VPPAARDELVAIRSLAERLSEDVEDIRDEVRGLRADLGGAPSADAPLIAFVHIPKTAGGTVTSMLARAYPGAALQKAGNYLIGSDATISKLRRRGGLSQGRQPEGPRVNVGHVPYGVFAEHVQANTIYMTFLREPVDRVLSHYFRHIHDPDAPSDTVVGSNIERPVASSLEEALAAELPQLTNLMTRFLCSSTQLPSEPLRPAALEEAKQNLRGFAFVGVQERFDESLVLLQRQLGLELVPYVNRHVSDDRPDVDEISSEQRALILEHNALDAELYEFALELFDQAVGAADGDVAADAQRLRSLSATTNEQVLGDASEFLDRELPEGSTRPISSVLAAAREQGISGFAVKEQARRQELYVVGMVNEEGERCWSRGSGAELEAALELLRRELPEGVTRPKSEITAAAKQADVPYPALKQAKDLLSISKSATDAGERFWTRGTAAESGPSIAGS